MAFSEVTSKVLLLYKADVSDAKSKIQDLKKAQTDSAKAELDALQAKNTAIEGTIAKYGKLALQVGAALGAIKFGMDAWQEAVQGAEEDKRLENLGISMERLKAATLGLRTESELHALVLKSQSGVYKLNADQLERTLKTMSVLIQDGRDANEVYAAFGDFMQTGATKGLKAFGIEAEGARNSSEALTTALEQMEPIAERVGSVQEKAGDSMRRSTVGITDAIDRLKEAIGKIIMAIEPAITAVLDLVSTIVSGWAKLAELAGDIIKGKDDQAKIWEQGASEDPLTRQKLVDNVFARTKADLKRGFEQMRGQGIGFADDEELFGVLLGIDLPRFQGMAAEHGGKAAEAFKEGIKKGLKGPKVSTEDTMRLAQELMQHAQSAGEIAGPAIGESLALVNDEMIRSIQDTASIALMQTRDILGEYEQFESNRKQSVLKSIFGEPEEINLLASGLNMLKGAATAAFSAWISGSESMGKAARKAIASSLAALGGEMLAKSVYHAAMALGSVALGDFRGAGTHAIAAAKFGAGAAVVGAIARKIAPSDGGATSGAGAGAGGGAGAGSSVPGNITPITQGAGNAGRNVTIVVGDDFADDSPRKRQQKAERIVQLGMRSTREVVFA